MMCCGLWLVAICWVQNQTNSFVASRQQRAAESIENRKNK